MKIHSFESHERLARSVQGQSTRHSFAGRAPRISKDPWGSVSVLSHARSVAGLVELPRSVRWRGGRFQLERQYAKFP